MADDADDIKVVDVENRDDVEDVDFSKLKKKKKKAKPVEVEADSTGAAESPRDVAENDANAGEGDEQQDLDAMFGEMKKKKKKKKVTIEGFEDEAAAPADSADTEFEGMKKKKKKGKKGTSMAEFEEALRGEEEEEAGGAGITFGEGEDEESAGADGREPWLGSDRDYTYKELLGRVFQNLRQNNPDLVGEKKKYTMTPPSIHREPKKTIFANLVDICRRMHRQPEHLIQFLFAELGTTGSVDGEQRLVIKGRFTQKQIEAILRRYIMDYVQCKTCKSPDTILVKENRLFFQQCESCNSTRSVAAIKTGFQALTGKRAAARRAAG